MAPNEYLFLNTTGPPGFSGPAAHRVRGHVTKTNFANRRRLKALAEAGERKTSTSELQKRDLADSIGSQLSRSNLAIVLSIATSRTDKQRAAELRG